ncbi:FAR1-related sequence 5-like protein [Tanacetum coccineum]|uniref:FAR1-related sequence 5-like protein n=1 Tax=Tanacetum coccineum TaxID=301880 RepID=A0ABQ4ZF85_9ASTR
MTEEGGDSNDIRSTYDEIDEEDEVFRSDYTDIDSMHYVKDADSDICEEIELSDGTFNYKPLVDESEKPKIGSEYSTIDKCIEMYAKYAEKSRFTIRKSTQEKLKSGIPVRKYLLCNKEGLPKGVNKDTMIEETSENQIRTGSIIRTGCLARAKFKINVTHTGYVLYEFEEAHNHTFVPKAYRNLTKKRKQMSHPEQIFVQQLGSTIIEATRAHHLYASTHGGYELVNATETEYQNHKRDLNVHIGDGDSQIQLSALFWADEMSKYNYKEFGDTISFDATFRTNKYNMVFVPFTGIDNHRKCVTFGVGMLSNETTKSYKWLLTSFLMAFHKQPRLVVTDQDPAMRNAIAFVFNESTHRLYFVQSTDNRENKWLSDMYNIRNRWIPAYFKDVELCGLMRTTSRSESENSFFSNFTSGGSTLINFMMCFEAAMERQRHRQEILDDSTMQKIPRFKTKLPIERYAQKKYTKTMFTLIQERINSLFYDCHRLAESLDNGIETVTIKEIREIKVNTSRKKYNFGETSVQNKRNQTKKELRFKVSTDKSDGLVICSCMNFARFGFLCRHIFCVLKGNGVEIIPDKYILKRWKRDILPPHIRRKRQMFGFEGGRYMECSATVYSAVEYCLNLLAKDEGKLIEFVENVKRLKTEVEEANPNAKQLSKKEMFNLVLGVEKPEVNTVKNPEPCSNKGNASGGQRKKSEIEKLREHMKKHRRLCKKCVKYRRHDSRNCPKKPDEIPTDSDSTVVSD